MILFLDELPDGLLQEAYEIWMGSLASQASAREPEDLDHLWPEDGGEPDPEPVPRDPDEETVLDLSGCIHELEVLCLPYGEGVLCAVISWIERENRHLLR